MEQFFTKKEEGNGLAMSMEDAAVFIADLQNSAGETQALFDELQRLGAMGRGVNDVNEIVASMTAQGGLEQELIAAVADMAMAGTDSDGTDLFGADPENADLIFEGIKETLASAWEMVENFFSKWFTFVGHWKARTDELYKRFDKIKNSELKNDKPIKISMGKGEMQAFIHGYKWVTGAKLKNEFSNMIHVLDHVFGVMPACANQIAKEVTNTARNWKTDQKLIYGQMDALGEKVFPISKKMLSIFDGGQGQYGSLSSNRYVLWTSDTLGGFRIGAIAKHAIQDKKLYTEAEKDRIVSEYEETNAGNDYDDSPSVHSYYDYITALTKLSFELRTQEGHVTAFSHGKPEFPVPDTSFIEDSLNGLRNLIAPFEHFYKGGYYKETKPIRANLESATKHALDISKNAKGRDGADWHADVLDGFNKAYARWAKEPMLALMYRVMHIVYAYLDLLDTAIKRYEKA